MKKTILKWSVPAFLVAIAAFSLLTPGYEMLKGEGRPSWFADVQYKNDGHGHLTMFRWLEPNEANAQQPAGGPAGGAPAAPVIGRITGQAAVSGGALTLRIPAAGYSPAVYTNCFISVASPVPAVAGNVAGCIVTSTATVTGSPAATSTVGAINIQAVGTSSATYSYMLTQ